MIGATRGRTRAGGPVLVAALAIGAAVGLPASALAGPTGPSGAPLAASSKVAPAADPHVTALTVSPPNLSLGKERVGSFFVSNTAIIANLSQHPIKIKDIAFKSGDTSDFVVGTDCFPHGKPRTLKPKQGCRIKAVFVPHVYGKRTAIINITESTLGSPRPFKVSGTGTLGYVLSGSPGGVASFGDAEFKGQPKPTPLSGDIVSLTCTTTGDGYWLLGEDGGVFTFGDAKFFGSTGAMHLNQPVVGMTSPRANNGYWLVASDGGIFSFGRVPFFGSTGGRHLNQPIVGMAATRSGNGYWLVARDGGIFTFGDAKFFGSAGGIRLAQPIVGMARTPSGNGYWLVARDGGVFTYGDAKFFGSGGGLRFGNVAGIAPTPNGLGYWLSNTAGQVFIFGDAPYFGDLFKRGTSNATGVAATAPPIGPTHPRTIIDEPSPAALNALMEPAPGHRVDLG